MAKLGKMLFAMLLLLLACSLALGEPDIVTVGPFASCDYFLDGVNDGVTINTALNSGSANRTVIGYGDAYIDGNNPVLIDGPTYSSMYDNQFGTQDIMTGKTLRGSSGSPSGFRLHHTNVANGDVIKINGGNVHVEDLTIEGHHLDADMATIVNDASNGIEIMGTQGALNSVIDNVVINNCGGAGIRKADNSYDTNNLGYAGWRNIWINRCGRGLYFNSGGDIEIYNLVVANPYYETVRLQDKAGYFKFYGGHLWEGGNGVLNETKRVAIFNANACNVILAGVGHNLFSGTEIDQFNYYGFYIWSDGTEWLGGGVNTFDGVRMHGADRADFGSLAFYSNSPRNVISGCQYYKDTTAGTYLTTAINLDGARAQHNVIVGNSFDSVTTICNDTGSNNIKEHNGV